MMKLGDGIRHSADAIMRFAIFVMLALGPTVSFAGNRIDIPKPTDAVSAPPAAPEVGPSILNIPVTVSLEELLTVADEAFPEVVTNEGEWRDGPPIEGQPPFQWQYRLHRGTLEVKVTDNQLETNLPDVRYRIGVRASKPGGESEDSTCGYKPDQPRHLSLRALSQLRWTDSWTVRATTVFDEPVFPDPCNSAAAGADVTAIVTTTVQSRLPVVAKRMDDRIQERSERRRGIERTWRKLQEPAELAPDLWLSLRPGAVEAAPITGSADQRIRTSVNVVLDPIVMSGPKPPPEEGQIPALKLATTLPDGFHLAVPVMADYPWINSRLHQQLVGQTIPMSIGSPVTITSAQLYGSGSNLIVALGVEGGVDGMLYATGRPVIDPATHILRFEQFDFTMDTKNILVRAANWMLRDRILEAIEPQTRIDLSGQIGALRRGLGNAMRREILPGTWLDGTVAKLEPRGIYPIQGGIEVQLVAEGTMELRLQ